MTDPNKNIRSDEVEQALEILSNEEEVKKYQKERYKRIFLSACQVLNTATEIRNFAECYIYGSGDQALNAIEKLPRLIYTKLPHAILELQDAYNRE